MPLVTVNPHDAADLRHVAADAARIMNSGGLVVFATETVYGVAASIRNDQGYQALRKLKSRGDDKPFTLHIPDHTHVERYVDNTKAALRRLVRKVFPGPVTLIVEVTPDITRQRMTALGLTPDHAQRLYHRDTIGLRCPDDLVAQHILAAIDAPVVATSANHHGRPPAYDAQEAFAAIGNDVDLVIDSGRTRYAKPSTIVRLLENNGRWSTKVEREGVYDDRFIRKLTRWTMLLVCSGNTCRSPMAEGIAKQILARARGLPVEELENANLRVTSAGAFASYGMPASVEAVDVLAKQDIDLSNHRSKPVTADLVHEADVIFCMTRAHRAAILAMYPAAADKVFPLDPAGDIEDPIGTDEAEYARCAQHIRNLLETRIKEQQP